MKLLRCLFFTLMIFLFVGCHEKEYPYQPTDDNFIQLKDSVFTLKGETYFPLMLNYVVDFRYVDSLFIVSPAQMYEYCDRFESQTQEEIKHQLRGHFQLIKEMGFNTLRICFNRINKDNQGRYFYQADEQPFYIDKDQKAIVDGLKRMLEVAEDADLHVMLLISPPLDKTITKFTQYMLSELSDRPTLFAYDFMNEPLYHDIVPKRSKKEAIKIVTAWQKMVRKYAPNQLFTIGFSEPLEVFEWDPSLLPVDFIAFHTYHPLRVKNEIYWFSTYVNKPWMIGETSLPADNDSISYDLQRQFMREVYHYVRDCGGIGMGWWEFQEVPYTTFEGQYTALLNARGFTHTKDGNYEIFGTVKPAVEEIAHFAEYQAQSKVRPVNYYNMMGYNNYLIRGQVLDSKTHKPIEGAVIRGWNKGWGIGQNTFTDSLGRFTLYSNDKCIHFEISAPGMTKEKFNDNTLKYKSVVGNIDEESLKNKKLEYQRISFMPYMHSQTITESDSDNFIFNFDEKYFHQHKFEAEMAPCYLKKMR